jgi:2-C-methyl-D-erythritol 4-phosphate cytidylyltransferase/2-C-methyl-D-erythritol 2,4-cyclodiphosphate synthase|tara:strand:- start:5022 stop:6176 length:1155 start_codon:yes stop_codon:yes gene_type:complete
MNPRDNIAVIIPAAGSSSRFGGSTPKQFLSVGDETVLEKSVNLFLGISSIKEVILAINPNESLIKSQSFYKDTRVRIVEGGSTRSESVSNALAAIDQSIEIVAIHDAARPWVTKSHFEYLLSKFANDQSIEGVFPVISVTDSLRMKQGEDIIPVERENFLHVQTPQIFYHEPLKLALDKLKKENLHMSDESQAMDYAGFKLLAVPGERSNIKITYTDDIPNQIRTDLLIGRGVDFHQFQPGSGLTLGNIFIDCKLSIVAHSDGDIILHAISDALLGAGGLRDIGYYFPDTDLENKNLSSLKIVEKTLDLLKENGLQPRNIDFVVVCEQPKIGPYVDQLKKSLSGILNIEESFIGVKATTTEKMGIIGDGNGIAVYAIASLRDLE